MVRPAERPPIIEDVTVLAAALMRMRRKPPGHALLVGVSGVDVDENAKAGRALADALDAAGLHVARIRDTRWHSLPDQRYNPNWPPRHYYEKALRLDEMFDDVIMPLMFERSIHVVCNHADETSSEFQPVRYDFDDVDVVIVESLFLYKKAHRSLFDLALWVDCTFDQALERAVQRCSEPPERTVRAYETIYFPAQRIQLRRDEPQLRADVVYSTGRTATVPGRMTKDNPRSAASNGTGRRTRAGTVSSGYTGGWDETLVRLPL
jgi:uridine kinase